jgi:BirA family transcriptional regulator, biotin operon repressor / biotin---[acetyl-CoA-carboxylase] ligase
MSEGSLLFRGESPIILGIKNSSTVRTRRSLRAGTPATHGVSAPHEQVTDLRLGRIVRLLMEHATVVVSGTKIAQEISSSRSASGRSSSGRSEVWRLIQQLRGLGVDVAGHPATGYQLRSVPDLLLPEILRPLVGGTIFDKHLHHFYKTGSTNTVAMAAAAEGAPEGSVFLAEEQTAGRGRGSNMWQSTRSKGIYCSVVLRPALPPAEVLVLSLAAGLAVQAAITQIDARVHVDLKWPNDVLIGGEKVCGILTEMNAEATRVRYLVVGVGINVNQESFPKELGATSLRLATGSEWSRVELAGALLKSLDREYRQLIGEGRARESILRRFAENSSWVRNKEVRVEENGAIEGTTAGLDARGFLQVQSECGLQTVLSGTVRGK